MVRVQRAAYEVESEEDEAKIIYYETRAYEAEPCIVTFMDGKTPAQVEGKALCMLEMQRR